MNNVSAARERRLAAIAWTLAIVPALVLVLYIAIYTVNAREWDHVNDAEVFDRWDRGELTLEYLFRQHNEHRKTAPRLLVLGLGQLTRWDTRAENFMLLAVVAGTALILFAAFRRDAALTDSPAPAPLWFVPAARPPATPRPDHRPPGEGLPYYPSHTRPPPAPCRAAL